MRQSERTVDAIKRRYWPRIGSDGKLIAPQGPCDKHDRITKLRDGTICESCLNVGAYPDKVSGEYSPDVVWVGPFIDGLIHVGVFGGQNKKAARQTAKSFFYEKGDAPADPLKRGGFDFTFERAVRLTKKEWPYAGTTYADALDLRSISGSGRGNDVEPGDIVNSPVMSDVGGDIWERRPEIQSWQPSILIDNKYQLHILQRGDRITKVYTTRVGGEKRVLSEVFVLRPPSEGTSKTAAKKDESRIVV